MAIYECTICGYQYNEYRGHFTTKIKPGTNYKDLPKSWTCPVCGAQKNLFIKVSDSNNN